MSTLSLIASNKHLLAVNRALLKIIAISRYISKNIQGIKLVRIPIINCLMKKVSSIIPLMGLRKTLRWCNFSYAQWRRLLNKQLCARSPFQLCRKKHPAQLLNKEINVLTNTCIDPAYTAWPLSSIYHQLIRAGQLYCSLSSFYKYCAKLVSRPVLPKNRRKIIVPASEPKILYRYYMPILPFSEQQMVPFPISTLYRTIVQGAYSICSF